MCPPSFEDPPWAKRSFGFIALAALILAAVLIFVLIAQYGSINTLVGLG